jgi:hypothetical protein
MRVILARSRINYHEGMHLFISFILAAALMTPETISAPPSIPREKGSIVVSDEHQNQRWTAEWTMEPALENGRHAVRFTETGRGHYAPYTQPIRWSVTAVWTADNSFYPLRFERNVTDMNGRPIGSERKMFDPAKRSVRFERKRENAAVETKELQAPADTVTVEGIAGILSFLPFDHWKPSSVHFLTNEPRLVEMKVQMRGKERIKTPAGEFECYRVELVPELGVLNIVRSLLPKAQFWFSTSPRHFFVRYEGPENGAGSPHVIMELKDYQR